MGLDKEASEGMERKGKGIRGITKVRRSLLSYEWKERNQRSMQGSGPPRVYTIISWKYKGKEMC